MANTILLENIAGPAERTHSQNRKEFGALKNQTVTKNITQGWRELTKIIQV